MVKKVPHRCGGEAQEDNWHTIYAILTNHDPMLLRREDGLGVLVILTTSLTRPTVPPSVVFRSFSIVHTTQVSRVVVIEQTPEDCVRL